MTQRRPGRARGWRWDDKAVLLFGESNIPTAVKGIGEALFIIKVFTTTAVLGGNKRAPLHEPVAGRIFPCFPLPIVPHALSESGTIPRPVHCTFPCAIVLPTPSKSGDSRLSNDLQYF